MHSDTQSVPEPGSQEAQPARDLGAVISEPLDPASAEQVLRERLAGRRMIFELGFDEADFRRYRQPLFRALRSYGVEQTRRRFPALLATYMTYAGTFLYEGGEYWTRLHPHLQPQDVEAGRQFLTAVRTLRLESFDRIVTEEKGLTWVSRILAQGGIPRSCLGPFTELVLREVNGGVADGMELLATWRARGASLTQLHVPTRRFLLYGGDAAIDLANRCIELLRDRTRLGQTPTASEAGLPQYVVDAFAAVDEHGAKTGRHSATADGVPRPQLRLEPYDGLGPVVVLPQVAPDKLGGVWRVEAGDQVHRQEPSSYAPETVRVPPVPTVDTEFLTSDGLRRKWSFELLRSGAVLFFDPSSQGLVRDSHVLAAEEIWVLSPASATITAKTSAGEVPAREIQQLPAPTGAWSGFQLLHLDLHDVVGLRIDDGQGVDRTIAVTPPRARPELSGASLDGLFADGDAPVYLHPPAVVVPAADEPISWSVQVRGGGWAAAKAVLPESDGRIDLGPLLPADTFGAYSVRVRGAIGSDLNARFAVIGGLAVCRPEGIIFPSSDPPVVTVRAPDVAVDDGGPGQEHTLTFHEGSATTALARLRHVGGRKLDLSVAVPRLVWTIVHSNRPAVAAGTHVVRVDAEEFNDQFADTLLVSVGRAGVGLRIDLRDRDSRSLRALAPVTTVGDSGRWAFDLGPLASTIQTADADRLSLHVSIGIRDIRVADVISGAQVQRVLAYVDGNVLRVTFDQHRAVRDRVLRLWSTISPWKPPVQAAIIDGDTQTSIPIERLAPGSYLAEIAIDDPWTQAVRPRARDFAVRPVNVGDQEQTDQWLGALDPADPKTLVSWVLGRYRGNTAFPIGRLSEAASEIAVSFKVLLGDTDSGQPNATRFAKLANVVSARDTILAEVLARAKELDAGDEFLDRLNLRLVEFMDPTSDELGDSLMTSVWNAAPAIAALLDLPWAELDEVAADRCRLQLGWAPRGADPDPAGARVSQLELRAPAHQLRDLRFALGLKPASLLDPETRMLATFDWLLAQHDADITKADAGPRGWFNQHRALLELDGIELPTGAMPVLEQHIAARTPPYGTETWAAVPALLLAAAVQHRWAPSISQRLRALAALEEALPWARRLVRSDSALLTMIGIRAQGTA